MVSLSKKVVLEGNYSTYSQKWTKALVSFSEYLNQGAIDVKGKRVFLRGDINDHAILNLDDGAIIEEGTTFATSAVVTPILQSSVLGKYVIMIASATSIRIYKNGTLIQTLSVVGANFTYGMLISYNGKYIIALDGNTKTVYCFEGN